VRDRAEQTGPLLVTFPHGEGTVIFTSFRNEAQNTEMEEELLRHLVFTTVTAREEGKIRRTMVRGGFSPTARNLLSASSGGVGAWQCLPNCAIRSLCRTCVSVLGSM